MSYMQDALDVLKASPTPLTGAEVVSRLDPSKAVQLKNALRSLVEQGRAEVVAIEYNGAVPIHRYAPIGPETTDKTLGEIIGLVKERYSNGQKFTRGEVAKDLNLPYDAVCEALAEMRHRSEITKVRGLDGPRYCSIYVLSTRRR